MDYALHNFNLHKSNAQVYMHNYKVSGLHAYLVHAISQTNLALKYLKRNCEKCENLAKTISSWPDDNDKSSRSLRLCDICGKNRWDWLEQNANNTNMYGACIFTKI